MCRIAKWRTERTTRHLPIRATGGVFNDRRGGKGTKMMNEELKTSVDVRKNIKTLAEEYPSANIKEIVNDFNVKEILTYTH